MSKGAKGARSRPNGTRQPVATREAVGAVIDGLARGTLRAAADVKVSGERAILGAEGQEMVALSVLMQLPDTQALRRVIDRVGVDRLAEL